MRQLKPAELMVLTKNKINDMQIYVINRCGMNFGHIRQQANEILKYCDEFDSLPVEED